MRGARVEREQQHGLGVREQSRAHGRRRAARAPRSRRRARTAHAAAARRLAPAPLAAGAARAALRGARLQAPHRHLRINTLEMIASLLNDLLLVYCINKVLLGTYYLFARASRITLATWTLKSRALRKE